MSAKKEQFSTASIKAISSVARYTLYRPEVDDDSVDYQIAASGGRDTYRRPRIEVQLKSTSRDLYIKDSLAYPLKVNNYNDLRCKRILVPRILVVTVLPPTVDEWLEQTSEEMTLRHCSYWMSIRGYRETDNKSNVTVRIPRTQFFTPETLQKMMVRVNNGGFP